MARKSIKAVLLAAGRGSRLSRYTENLPKSLLPLEITTISKTATETIIERQIKILKELEINDIAVIVNYHKDILINRLQRYNVTFIENISEDITLSGNLHSFQYAIEHPFSAMDTVNNTLLMDADIVYEKAILENFLKTFDETNILVHPKYKNDGEEVLIYGKKKQPLLIGKKFTTEIINGMDCYGEALGIVHLHPNDHHSICTLINNMLTKKLSTEHEALSQQLMNLNIMKLSKCRQDQLFMEIDTPSDYHELQARFIPLLKR